MEMKEFAQAMVDFQNECPAIFKDEQVTVKTNNGAGYNFEFASYGNIIQTIKPYMFKTKLSYKFLTRDNKFVCRIRHVSGEFEDTEIHMPNLKDRMQDNGANLTYLKRYSLVLALGLDTDGDNDGADEGEVEAKKQAAKGHDPDLKKFLKMTDKDNYTLRVGKFKGMKLSEVGHLKIQEYLMWLQGQVKQNGRPLAGEWLVMYKICEAYIAPPEDPSEG